MAFVQALQAAALAHAVTSYCTSGQLTDCGCDQTAKFDTQLTSGATATTSSSPPTPPNFRWSGCSENVGFGVAFSSSFVAAGVTSNRQLLRQIATATAFDAAPSDKAVKTYLVNFHNRNAGHKVILLLYLTYIHANF